MAYGPSLALLRWRGQRMQAIATLAAAHAAMGEVDGPGRPLEIGRPVGHAYVLRVVAEFQAFVRDIRRQQPPPSTARVKPIERWIQV